MSSENDHNTPKKTHKFHALGRIKEKLLLKFTLLLLKFQPLLEKLKTNAALQKVFSHPVFKKIIGQKHIHGFLRTPKLKIYTVKAVIFISIIYLVIGMADVRSYYSEKAENSIESGQRIIISLPDGKMEARKKSIKYKTRKELASGEEENSNAESQNQEETGDLQEGATEQKQNLAGDYDIKDVRPRVIIVFSGLGLSRTTTENAFSLPAEIALSFSPYSANLSEWTASARELGFELLMDAPLEPTNYPKSDPGPYGILIQEEDKNNIEQLNKVLNLSEEKFVGVVAPLEEQFTFSEEKVLPILEELKNKGLVFVYTNKPRNYFLPQTAKNNNLKLVTYDVLLDEELSHDGIEDSIKKAERIASEKGLAIILARPYPITVKHLHEWLRSFQEKGLLLVPLSEIL